MMGGRFVHAHTGFEVPAASRRSCSAESPTREKPTYKRSVSELCSPMRPKRQPQRKPSKRLGVEECEALKQAASLASIESRVSEAVVAKDPTDLGDHMEQGLPLFQVGGWTLRGSLTSMSQGDYNLTNSTIRFGDATCDSAPTSEPIRVAVKSVLLSADEDSIEMVRREIEILKEIGDQHPHILPMLAYAEFPKEVVLLTPLAPQGDLRKWAPDGQCFEEREVRRLTMQVVSALAFLHGQRIIHGDVKAQNVFLTLKDGALLAQLADFGLTVHLPADQEFLLIKGVRGSYGNIPAEVIHGGNLSCAADLFAWGVVTFRLLASYDPFFPASAVTSPLGFDEACWDPVSAAAKSFVVQLLAVSPQVRGDSASLLCSHEWLVAKDEDLVANPRGPYAPQPLFNVQFQCASA